MRSLLLLGVFGLLSACAAGGALVLVDPAGDAPPPGVTLPLAEAFRAPGLYDLRELAVERRGHDLILAVQLGRPLEVSGEGGAELVSILVLVDTGPGGSRWMPEAPELRIARGAWNLAVRLDPWGFSVRDPEDRILAQGSAEVIGDRLVARIPSEVITMQPASAGWSVLVFSADVFAPRGVRPVLRDGGAWTLGGDLASGALDALDAPGSPGGTALSFGRVSFVRPSALGPQPFLWLTVVGLLIYGGAIMWGLWRTLKPQPAAIQEWDEEDGEQIPGPLPQRIRPDTWRGGGDAER